MTTWIDIGSTSELADVVRLNGEVDGYAVTVTRIDGTLYAWEDRCTHDDAPLSGGDIEGMEVICPRHGSRFSLRTGEALTPPAYEPLRLFTAREADGRILVAAP